MRTPPINPSATAVHGGGHGLDAEERVLRADLRIAAVVRDAPLPALPADFARSVARHARRVADAADASRVEQSLLATLATVLVGAAAWYGSSQTGTWLAPLVEVLPDVSTLAWLAAAGACVGVNWLLGRLSIAGEGALPEA